MPRSPWPALASLLLATTLLASGWVAASGSSRAVGEGSLPTGEAIPSSKSPGAAPAPPAGPSSAPSPVPTAPQIPSAGPPTVSQPLAWTPIGELAPQIDDNQSVYFTVTVAGGTPPYSYTWWGLPIGGFGDCTAPRSAQPTCQFLEPGTYVISVNVTDYNGLNSGVSAGFPLVVISGPSVGLPTANVTSGDVGTQVSFSVVGESGAGGFSYSWPSLPLSCSGLNSNVVSCPLTSAGVFPVQAEVLDANGGTALSPVLEFDVNPVVEVGATQESRASADVGQSVQFRAVASGGSGIYPNWTWTGLSGANCTGPPGPVINCVFLTSGLRTVAANVHDSVGGFAGPSSAAILGVDPSLEAPTPLADRTSLDVGQSFTLTATPLGGEGPYAINWTGLVGGCASSGDVAKCSPTIPGSLEVGYTASDANGVVVSSAEVPVQVAPPFSAAALASTTSPTEGTSVDLLAEPVGGEAPYTATWSGGTLSASTGLSTTVVFSQTGTQSVLVTLRDANGENVTTILAFSVSSSHAPSSFFGLPPWAAALLIASVLLNALVIGALALTRTRRPSGRSLIAAPGTSRKEAEASKSPEEAPSDAPKEPSSDKM